MSESNTLVPLHQSDDSNDNSSDLDVPERETNFYYHGLRASKCVNRGPRLIYRTSTDIFSGLSGSWARGLCEMQLLTVHEDDKLRNNNLWDTIREQTAAILDRNQIKFTSIDLVRFRRDKKRVADYSSGTFITPVTIWIGVFPHSTKSYSAYLCTVEILKVLEDHNIKDMDVAFRESVTRPLACPGPVLYAPVSDVHPLLDVIDWLTTVLSLPIAGLTTPQVQGALGFYFKVGEDLYGVTSRHVLLSSKKGDVRSDPEKSKRKYIVLMGTQGFKDLLASVQDRIDRLTSFVNLYERNITRFEKEREEQAKADNQRKLDATKPKIVELKKFLKILQNDWSDIKNRIIGHVVWSPAISTLNFDGRLGYMRDVCVIKLDKKKFLPNLKGNVMDIGTKMGFSQFFRHLFPENGAPAGYDYPDDDRLYRLEDILTSTKIQEANIRDEDNDPTRFVFKNGPSTGTTFGRLNGFMSHVRRYTSHGNFDSIEAAVFPCDKTSDSFSKIGDSGAAIVGSNHEFIAQLTAGTGSRENSDITYGTPMEWLWENVIKAEFPNAVLFFDAPARK